ncbi:MAG: hypothetical protein ACK4NQ_01560 [Fimbriimonadaceae bacterium]
MSDFCWVCLGSRITPDGKLKGTRGACRSCSARLEARYGHSWCAVAKETIESGRRHELMPVPKSRNMRAHGDIPPHWIAPVPYFPPKPVSKQQLAEATRQALVAARQDFRKIVSIPIGDVLVGRSLFFEPFIDAGGNVQVRLLSDDAGGLH